MVKIQVETILFRRKDGGYELLLLRRIPEKGGFWQPTTGGFEEKDKSYLNTAYREVKEETGVDKKDIIRVIENVHYFEFNKHYLTGKPAELVHEYVFAFEVKPSAKVCIDCNIYPEHDAFEWVSFEKAIEMMKWEDNKN